MNNPFEYTPDTLCNNAFEILIERIERLKQSNTPEDKNFCRVLDEGKMLGVLIATDEDGARHTLYAFSGQIGNAGFSFGDFVEPVFDYLNPSGYFKTHETQISKMNKEIERFESTTLARLKEEYEEAENRRMSEISSYKEQCKLSKIEREKKRASGVSEEEESDLIRQSQFEKAELSRLKKRLAAEIKPHAEALENAKLVLSEMKEQRRADSEALQNWLFENFRLLNADGQTRSLKEIFADTQLRVPPSGAGECCAPKLLQSAYRRGLKPVSISEYWYGAPKEGEVRLHRHHYPACRGKCLPVLTWMMQGLDVTPSITSDALTQRSHLGPEIIFENELICVVNKPSGMLSVPGKGRGVSVEEWLQKHYGADREIRLAHRLDQDTSGLLVATFGPQSYKAMQEQFATRNVKKQYIAVLDGDYRSLSKPMQGCIKLSLSPDWLDRPRQKVDFTDGKEAVTEYKFLAPEEGRSRVAFYPHTGRTHQLRVTAASVYGLGMPIVGDRLYGKQTEQESPRLLLHAQQISFIHPIDGKLYEFESVVPF